MKYRAYGSLTFLLFILVFGVPAAVFSAQQPEDTLIQSGSAAEASFAYSPKGRRDPFKPLIQDQVKTVKKSKGRAEKLKGPLEKFELSQYRLVALMVVKGVPRAMVKAPDGKSYTVKVGEYIGLNGGIVKNIETKVIDVDANGMRIEKSPDRIVVEEVGIDSYTGNEVRENRYIVM